MMCRQTDRVYHMSMVSKTGINVPYLLRWLGRRSIQTTLICPELVPGPTGSLADVPQ